jgi:hypothetical protein
MATLVPGDIPIQFGGQNPAAAASEAALWPLGLGDVTDVDGVRMPSAGVVVGVSISGAPASGDTVTCQARVNTTNVTGVSAQITNAAPTASAIVAKDANSTQQFAAGDLVKCRYTTTTGGTYTAKDLVATVWVRPFLYP